MQGITTDWATTAGMDCSSRRHSASRAAGGDRASARARSAHRETRLSRAPGRRRGRRVACSCGVGQQRGPAIAPNHGIRRRSTSQRRDLTGSASARDHGEIDVGRSRLRAARQAMYPPRVLVLPYGCSPGHAQEARVRLQTDTDLRRALVARVRTHISRSAPGGGQPTRSSTRSGAPARGTSGRRSWIRRGLNISCDWLRVLRQACEDLRGGRAGAATAMGRVAVNLSRVARRPRLAERLGAIVARPGASELRRAQMTKPGHDGRASPPYVERLKQQDPWSIGRFRHRPFVPELRPSLPIDRTGRSLLLLRGATKERRW